MDAMHGMLKQEGGVNKANLMGSEPKLTSSAPLEKGEDSDEPVWLVSTRALSAGSCFIDRPYCAASPQASHRGLPGPRSCDKRTIHQNPAPYRLAYKRSRATALKRTAPSSMTCENKEGGPATGPPFFYRS